MALEKQEGASPTKKKKAWRQGRKNKLSMCMPVTPVCSKHLLLSKTDTLWKEKNKNSGTLIYGTLFSLPGEASEAFGCLGMGWRRTPLGSWGKAGTGRLVAGGQEGGRVLLPHLKISYFLLPMCVLSGQEMSL